MILEIFFFVVAIVVLVHALAGLEKRSSSASSKRQPSPRISQALDYAERLYASKRFHAAEKAYLDVLKLDHQNAVAYTHLGIIYTHLKNYPDAIECLQIATQLSPSAASYYSLGVVYFENHDYAKAVAAYEKAIVFEPSVKRYCALGKAYQRANNLPQMVTAYEHAVALEPENIHVLRLLQEGYTAAKERDKARELSIRIAALGPQKAKAVGQPAKT